MMTEKHLTLLCQLLNDTQGNSTARTQLQYLANAEWEQIINLAGQHGILPILYRRIKALDEPLDIPEAALQRLHTAYLTNATRNTLFLHEGGIIFKALKDAGIPVIGLKGLFLLENIYQDIGLRQMSDLDIMLHKTHIPQVFNILDVLGYQPTTYFDIRNENFDIKHVPPLLKPQGPYYVELHWTILEENEPFTIDATGLWERAMPASIASVDALALSPEDLVLHLCLHLAYQHHLKLGLRGVCDVAVTLWHFTGQLNWDKLVEIAHTWGATRVLWLTLTLAEDLLGAPIPSEIWAQVQSESFEPWVIEEAGRQLLNREHSKAAITPDLAKFAQEQGIIKRTRQMLSRVFLPKVTLARLYNVPPNSLRIYGCYFRRFGDLFRAYAPTVKRVFTSDVTIFEDVKKEQSTKKLKNWMIENNFE
jgi:hypothetical protein